MNPYSNLPKFLQLVAPCLVLLLLNGCAITNWWPVPAEGCNIQASVNLELQPYLSSRYGSDHPARLAVMPFDVPESFAQPGAESGHFGRELARKLTIAMLSRGVVPIVELFNRDRWPGKREEFFTGNYQAIALARNAGYDLVLVGYMDEIKDAETFEIYTKIIDTSNNITVWFGKNRVFTNARTWRKQLSRTPLFDDRPDLFSFEERVNEFAECAVTGILEMKPKP